MIALLIAVQPHVFTGLITIGTLVLFFDVVIFTLLTVLILARFSLYPGTFTRTLSYSMESIFMYVDHPQIILDQVD